MGTVPEGGTIFNKLPARSVLVALFAWSIASEVAAVAREFSTIGIIGLGTMGTGIAEVVARTGLRVVAVELEDRKSVV